MSKTLEKTKIDCLFATKTRFEKKTKYLVHVIQLRAKAAMHAEDLFIDDRRNGECVEPVFHQNNQNFAPLKPKILICLQSSLSLFYE
jgi:hypothetical protein